MKKINVLSLFDGMGCAWLALEKAGIETGGCWSSEVDKDAIAQVRLNFPHVKHIGDIRDVDVHKLGHIDLIMAGSPCQDLSMSGKINGLVTKDNEEVYTLERYLELKEQGFEFEGQSFLFWEFMRILSEVWELNHDVKFLLENVKMPKKWEAVFDDAVGMRGVHIDSALVSAQHRKRIYWTNFRTGTDSGGNAFTDIPQPEDRGIFLQDILEDDADPKYLVTPKCLAYVTDGERLKKKYTQIDGDKAITLTAKSPSNWTGNYVTVAMRGRPGPDGTNVQRLEPRHDGKTNCLTSVEKDNLIGRMDEEGLQLRRLTPLEYARLQTVPESYEWGCIESKRYRMLGNGWNVDTIVHILQYLKNRTET